MKIEILNQKIELTNKVNCFVPSDELCEEGLELLYLDLQEIKNKNFVKLNIKECKSVNNQKEYFINSFHNKEKLNNPNYTLWLYTSNPLYILWLPENSCVYKVNTSKIERFDYSYYKGLTPNALLTSEIFDCTLFNDDISLQDLRSEDDYKEIVFEKLLDKKLAEMAQRKEDRFNQLFNPENK